MSVETALLGALKRWNLDHNPTTSSIAQNGLSFTFPIAVPIRRHQSWTAQSDFARILPAKFREIEALLIQVLSHFGTEQVAVMSDRHTNWWLGQED